MGLVRKGAKMEEALYSLYRRGAGGYSTAERLHRAARAAGLRLSRAKVATLMRGWETYTRFLRKYRKPKQRDRVVVYGPFDLFQVDLAFLPKYRGFIGFLVAVDCFTRMVYVRTIKTKQSAIIAAKMSEIIEEAGSAPQRLTSDYGTEFIGQEFKNLLKKHRIHQFFTNSYQKSQFAERAIRSLKTLIKRAQYGRGTNDWPSLVGWAAETMNARVHSATGMRPVDVSADNAVELFRKLYPHIARDRQPPSATKPQFAIRDNVRILIPSKTFTKGFEAQTSKDVYQIARILFHPTIRYKLSNQDSDQIISGSFAANELLSVTLPQRK